jgi:hypothetical protein
MASGDDFSAARPPDLVVFLQPFVDHANGAAPNGSRAAEKINRKNRTK